MLQLRLPEVLSVYWSVFCGELEASLTISSSPVMDKWLFNATSIFFNLMTRMTVLLFSRFLVCTCGSPILVCPFMRLFRHWFSARLS